MAIGVDLLYVQASEMDNSASSPSGSLEDRLRNMILLHGTIPDNQGPNQRPNARLAPQHENRSQPFDSAQPAHPEHSQLWDQYAPAQHQRGQFPPSVMRMESQVYPNQAPPSSLQRGTPTNRDFNGQQTHARGSSYGNNSYRGRFSSPRGGGVQHQNFRQQLPLEPVAFQRGYPGRQDTQHVQPPRQLFDPQAPNVTPGHNFAEVRERQAAHLEQMAADKLPPLEMSAVERLEKEAFRQTLEKVCQEICDAEPHRHPRVSLECFGSFKSGFAPAGSDMDLVIVVTSNSSSSSCFSLLADDLPRTLEKRLLELGYGAHLLTRTRVPIIKVCELPGADLLNGLREEREKWDSLPDEKKYPHLYPEEEEAEKNGKMESVDEVRQNQDVSKSDRQASKAHNAPTNLEGKGPEGQGQPSQPNKTNDTSADNVSLQSKGKKWTRERTAGPLDFPKSGVGIQSDINFFNPLGLHNTHMLHCYSLCDPRVRPMVLFVKSWAKERKINSSYSGTLSSYGYVLMVLHYLINIVKPPVLPNLQHPWRPNPNCTPQGAAYAMVDGWAIDFWRSEHEIQAAAFNGQLSINRESLGSLLAGFFHYFSSMGGGLQFRWMQQVLSLRTMGGLLTKEEKGWVKAMTEEGDGKRVQHRYLFCIEDPFELSHNVARTVTHHGIVAIRDEFRRTFRILDAVGHRMPAHEGDLFAPVMEDGQITSHNKKAKPGPMAVGSKTGGTPTSATAQRGQQQKKVLNRNSGQGGAETSQPNRKPVDITDNDAFPTLGSKNTKLQKNDGFVEISGERAKAYLEGLKRKKAEAQAEDVATSAAEAVLNETD